MPTLQLDISAETLQQLQELPQQIAESVGAAQGQLDRILAGEDPASSISSVLGELSSLAAAAEQIPGVDDVLERVREVAEGLPEALGVDAGVVEDGLAVVFALVEPV